MIKNIIRNILFTGMLFLGAQSAQAVPVDLELILAADVSGSVDSTDFALQRAGFEAAFRSAGVISAIESGAIGSIAVTLWDFATNTAVAVNWSLITDAASSNAFADAVSLAGRGSLGCCDGQSNMIDLATASLVNDNGFEGTRGVLDVASEGAQDIDGCAYNVVTCVPFQNARDNFLAQGNNTINAIWLQDRNFFGLNPGDIIDAYEYGNLNVIGGTGAFQTYATDFTQFAAAIEAKLIREITGAPEPTALALLGIGLLGLVFARRSKV